MPRKGGRKTMKGGIGAASHGVSVYGAIGDQQRASPEDNLIAVKPQMGGKRRRRGGSTGVDLGASLALLGLNELTKRRRTSVKKGGKSKKAGKRGRRRSMKKGGNVTLPPTESSSLVPQV
uniref:Uncharacterized protein n=1 Tax=viral metagenome TaxID=1070528 RepID=A0A6C0B3M8_9ZZZZ